MNYKFLVIEHYPDGGTWRHYFRNEQEALWAIEDMQNDHKGRKYILTPYNEEA